MLLNTQTPLKSILTEANLSKGVSELYNGDLPFLFKVLSINKALSIQAHPDKQLAQNLFAKFPDVYKDSNHKPEMALALTPFEAFIGFRPVVQIAQLLDRYPEFAAAVGPAIVAEFNQQVTQTGVSTNKTDIQANKRVLKLLFAALMRQDPTIVASNLQTLLNRIDSSKDTLDALLKRLNAQFPLDVGCFCALLLNYIELQSGDAIFLAANEPHAYISGDCVECMATSDNVVRSGLTPKFKDVDTLVDMLTYNYGPSDAQVLHGVQTSKHTKLYDPPIDEFSVAQTTLRQGDDKETVNAIEGPSVAIVTEGSGSITADGVTLAAKTGFVFFIGANQPVSFQLAADASQFVVYRAYCQL